MADKKTDDNQPGQDELVKKIDAMMDIKGAGPKEPRADDPAIDIKQFEENLDKSLLGTKFGSDPSSPTAPSKPANVQQNKTEPQTAPVLPADPEAKSVVPEDDAKGQTAVVEPSAESIATKTESENKPSAAGADLPAVNIDDTQTQKAVDDIVAKEGDTILAVEDAKKDYQIKAVVSKVGFKERLRLLFKSRWFLVVLALLILVFALPLTRYKILGLVIKKDVTIVVADSKTATPVSAAEVNLGGVSAKTNAHGEAKLKVGLGQRDLKISKPYYTSLDTKHFVGFKEYKGGAYKLVATGRLVPITVTNKITGKPLSNATIISKSTTAKTDKNGKMTIALPVKESKVAGKLRATGYLAQDIEITVTDKAVATNSFAMITEGQIYFLSNQSGKLDVVKTNLDGSGRKTLLAGTGKEDPRTTSLLASRDWRYLVLKAKRDSANESLYIIDTSIDKVTQFDSGEGELNLVGWYDHNFIYQVTKANFNFWQPGRQVVKSYDAERSQLNQIDQSQAEGTSTGYAYQELFNFYIVDGLVAYNTAWSGYNSNGTPYDLSSKNDSIRAVQPGGLNKKDYLTFQTSATNFIQASLYEPGGVYYAVYNSTGKPTFYVFENQTVKTAAIDQATFDKQYPTYLLSPAGSQTFWAEQRDGKNALFIGDKNAAQGKQIASLSEYAPYGWFSDSYILLTKKGSELYITTTAMNPDKPPLKITDYYKPALNYAGYGYGYGGL